MEIFYGCYTILIVLIGNICDTTTEFSNVKEFTPPRIKHSEFKVTNNFDSEKSLSKVFKLDQTSYSGGYCYPGTTTRIKFSDCMSLNKTFWNDTRDIKCKPGEYRYINHGSCSAIFNVSKSATETYSIKAHQFLDPIFSSLDFCDNTKQGKDYRGGWLKFDISDNAKWDKTHNYNAPGYPPVYSAVHFTPHNLSKNAKVEGI
ncbi:hypothetical protein BY996DRAFT_7536150 [Phakopsora pachyrhizi]|uniref:Expressed protein n=1 Tax=Phakopsora pachyrhizi TaxID=170000 RepID=A0AAV0BJ30_PHAPC|nr:hypothetical protein BY996DRAFT_7536150 [Phakopsora pachyrhizi]CAH7686678.1 expressed protein [Phakopsora pachyrhizi]